MVTVNDIGRAVPVPCISSAQDFLQSALDRLQSAAQERDAPDGERSMARAVKIFNAWTGNDMSEADGWSFMVALKQARSVQGNFVADDGVDMAGYVALLFECCSK